MLLSALAALTMLVAPDSVRVTVTPATVLAAPRGGQQVLNFDFLLANPTADTLTLDEIELVIRDDKGRFVTRRFLRASALATVQPASVLPPGAEGALFNPFQQFDRDTPLGRLDFTFHFRRSSSDGFVMGATSVVPTRRLPRTTAILPMAGRLLVDDGHDFYSHHRRLDLLAGFVKAVGVTRNFERYALDLLPVDTAGRRYHGDGRRLEDWFGYAQLLVAPTAGRVVAAHGTQPDNSAPGVQDRFDPRSLAEDPLLLYGNYVVLDYGSGEFGVLGHLQPGSLLVQVGDRVGQGQAIARAGSSGSSLYPHVHYELRSAATLDADGLPVYFTNVRRLDGVATRVEPTWFADTGDVLEAATPIRP